MSTAETLLAELRAIVGAAGVRDDAEERAFYSRDLFFSGEDALAVVRPRTRDELAAVVRTTTAANHAVIARGGGLSYTKAYVPSVAGAVMIDTCGLDKIIALSPENMTVTAECGCTWEQIYRATAAHGLRPVHFGPTTGRYSTLGGGLSHGSMFFNSACAGTAADSVLGLEVVVADGHRVITGANAGGASYFRNHGPDLTGLFLNDAGALGVKASATLRLAQIPKGVAFASFAFTRHPAMIDAATRIGRTGLAAECLGVGAHPAPSQIDAVGAPTLHVVVEGFTQAIADAHLKCVIDAAGAEARVRPGSVPQAIRQDPFGFLKTPLDAQGRRQIWTHGIFPFDQAVKAYAAVAALLDAHQALLNQHKITAAITIAIAGTVAFIEPILTWSDAPTPLHLRGMTTIAMPAHESNPAATRVVRDLRELFRDLYAEMNAAHLQLGKFYAFSKTVAPETQKILVALKHHIDPKNLMNPHALGLT